MMEISEIDSKLNDNAVEDMDDAEDGEILEDGEIADEEEVSDKNNETKVDEKENNSKDRDNKDFKDKDRDSRRRDDSNRKLEENKSRDKERERNRDRDREKDRDRRHDYQRSDRSDRERKSAERERKSSNDDEREKRRRERDRKRRRSDEEDDRDKRKRGRDQAWPDYGDVGALPGHDYDRFREDIDFRLNDPSFVNINNRQIHEDDDEDLDDGDFEEMMQIMEHQMPVNRMAASDSLPPNEKRAMMRAMVLMMKRNMDSDKSRRLNRLRDKRRTRDRTPGPTGTRATTRQPDRPERVQTFKPLCKFFMDGKCHKGSDCTYSHESSPSKKKEICKYYLQGFCGKGEECLFMHNEFPCKFFHTNVECYSGENCRFSHAPLTEESRELLRNYLDSGQLPDDPKPDKNDNHSKGDNNRSDLNSDNRSQTDNNSLNNKNSSQNTSTTNTTSANNTTTYTPMKPVPKRHAILGDPTHEMKNSYYTWQWQQEMKGLEVAYVGNKRNLFCIESKFAITEKPPTPRMEDDEEEIEAQIRNYYMDTMGDFDNQDNDNDTQNSNLKTDEEILIEASAHDEDLRMLAMRPTNKNNESVESNVIQSKNEFKDFDERAQLSEESKVQTEVPQTLPKVARDLYVKMQNKLQNESESKSSWLSDSDDDDKDVLAAALKNVQQKSSPKSHDKSKSPINISQMLSAIRQSSNTSNTNANSKQSEFWQNILSGINLAGTSPSGNNTPPRNDYRDPRLKRGKESPTVDISPPVKICDPNVKIEYKLLPVNIVDIDYSCYVSIYRIDSRLKNDPRLQKFFSKLPASEIDNMSRIVPPPLKTAPVTPLSVLKYKKKNEKEKRDKKVKASSPTLPPLPPLTISPSKAAPAQGIIPPTPPPIMSPLELISSRPTFTVRDTKTTTNASHNELITKSVIKIENKSPVQSASSPESSKRKEDNENENKTNSYSFAPILPTTVTTTAANSLPSITSPEMPSLSSPPQLSNSFTSLALNSELFQTSINSNINLVDIKKENEVYSDDKMETNSNNSLDDDLYDNMYAPITDSINDKIIDSLTDSSKTGQQLSISSSPNVSEDELEMIRNELKVPIQAIDSDPEMEIDLRERKDSVSEVESADECELMIASSSETEDNNTDNDINNENNSINSNTITSIQSNNEVNNEPINLSVGETPDSQTIESTQSETTDQSLKSVFSTIDPTASPFC